MRFLTLRRDYITLSIIIFLNLNCSVNRELKGLYEYRMHYQGVSSIVSMESLRLRGSRYVQIKRVKDFSDPFSYTTSTKGKFKIENDNLILIVEKTLKCEKLFIDGDPKIVEVDSQKLIIRNPEYEDCKYSYYPIKKLIESKIIDPISYYITDTFKIYTDNFSQEISLINKYGKKLKKHSR